MESRYTVLVVERSGVARGTTRRYLARSGCRVLEATSANQALAVLRSNPHVDLVLIGAIGSDAGTAPRWR